MKLLIICDHSKLKSHLDTWEKICTLSGHSLVERGNVKGAEGILLINYLAHISPFDLKLVEEALLYDKRLYALESWGRYNGIRPNHFQHIRDEVKELGISGISLIDTTAPRFKPWHELLPPPGEKRSTLVQMVEVLRKDGRKIYS